MQKPTVYEIVINVLSVIMLVGLLINGVFMFQPKETVCGSYIVVEKQAGNNQGYIYFDALEKGVQRTLVGATPFYRSKIGQTITACEHIGTWFPKLYPSWTIE